MVLVAVAGNSGDENPNTNNVGSTYDADLDGLWSPLEVRNALQTTANDLGGAGHDNLYGYGLVDAQAALN